MSLIRAFFGVFGVMFSIQPLMSWAAVGTSGVSKNAKTKTDSVKIIQIARSPKDSGGGSPTCGGGY